MENPAPKDAIPEGEWQVSEVSSGSTIGRGMCAEKRRNDRSEEGGTLNSGGPGAEPARGENHEAASGSQRNEETEWGDRESDPLLIVGDGRIDHMAKERADGHRGQSTHVRRRNTGREPGAIPSTRWSNCGPLPRSLLPSWKLPPPRIAFPSPQLLLPWPDTPA